MKRALQGVDDLSFELKPLSCQERMINLGLSIVFLLPIINAIVWVTMKIFNKIVPLTEPCVISNPHFAPLVPFLLKEPVQMNPLLIQRGHEKIPAAIQKNQFFYSDRMGDYFEDYKLSIETHFDQTIVQKQAPSHHFSWFYDREGQLQKMIGILPDHSAIELHVDPQELHVTLMKGETVRKEVYPRLKNIPILQEVFFGPRKFLYSDEEKLEFYFLHPETLQLLQLNAEKSTKKTEGITEITIGPSNRFYSWVAHWFGIGGKFWYDRQGVLQKMALMIPQNAAIHTEIHTH